MPKRTYNTVKNNKKASDNDDVEIISEDNEPIEVEVPAAKKQKNSKKDIQDPQETILTLLHDAKPSGKYSIGGEATEMPIAPGIVIKDFGILPLPLNELQAESLIKICARAPYGHNFETKVDTKVRDTYQLEPSSVEISNPDWLPKLQALVDRIAKTLGCSGKVEAKLYKLLLYKTGGHFKKHMDTEKDKNMFGTLVLQLPSVHEGGELVIYNPDKTKTIHDFGQLTKKAPYAVHFAAHYADAEHEVLKVKSGYRLALIYSLCWVSGNGDCLPCELNSVNEMAQALGFFTKSNNLFGMMLDHKYTPSSFKQNGIKALKGIDNDRYNLLRNASSCLPTDEKLCFYVAHICLVVDCYDVGGNYYSKKSRYVHYEWEENERDNSIKEWYDVHGNSVFDNSYSLKSQIGLKAFTQIIDPSHKRNLSEDEFRNEDLYIKNDKDEDIEGYTGNESATKTTTYHNYILVFHTVRDEFDFYMKIDHGAAAYALANSFDTMPEKRALENLDKLFKVSKSFSAKTMAPMLKIMEKIKNLQMTRNFIAKMSIDSENVVKSVANAIVAFGWENIDDCLVSLSGAMHLNKLSMICKLVKEIYECKQVESSLKCLKKYLVPVLNNAQNIANLQYTTSTLHFYSNTSTQRKENENYLDVVYEIIETLVLFQGDNVEIYLNSLTSMLGSTLKSDYLQEIVNRVVNNIPSFKSSPALVCLIQTRINWLNDKLNKRTWYMPGSIPNHPLVEEFLRSEKQKLAYSGTPDRPINGPSHAENFINRYEGCKDGYSVVMEYTGTGSKIVIHIQKTREYFDKEKSNMKAFKAELTKLQKMLK